MHSFLFGFKRMYWLEWIIHISIGCRWSETNIWFFYCPIIPVAMIMTLIWLTINFICVNADRYTLPFNKKLPKFEATPPPIAISTKFSYKKTKSVQRPKSVFRFGFFKTVFQSLTNRSGIKRHHLKWIHELLRVKWIQFNFAWNKKNLMWNSISFQFTNFCRKIQQKDI